MLRVKINNFEFLVSPSLSVLEACQYVGIHIPRFCYHENISIAGNCRMCLDEIEKAPKPVASCALPISNNLSIYTDSPLVKKARENVLETLLLNHPLDCPICDQGGECDLQDQTKIFGGDYSRFQFKKRVVEDKPFGSFIKTIMTRCIHCTRCVRFSEEVAGVSSFGTFNRGCHTEIGAYTESIFNSEVSGNVIDLCPVGALTSKSYAFKARPWELKCNETIDFTDGLGTPILVNTKELNVARIQPKIDDSYKSNFISDKIRFSYDALKRNRVKNVFLEQKGLKKHFLMSTWGSFYSLFAEYLNNNKKTLFIIKNLDIHSLTMLKKFKNTSSLLNVGSLFNNNSDKKLYNFASFDDLSVLESVDTCVLISTNLKLECTLLNTRLRTRFQKRNFQILSVGSYFSTDNLSTIFMNVTPFNTARLFEGRIKSLKTFDNVLFIVGNSFEMTFSSVEKVTSLLRRQYPSCYRGVSYTHTDTINSKLLLVSTFLLCVNMEDNIFARKLLYGKTSLLSKKIAWFNSYGSVMASKANYILPISLDLEEENLYLNLESRFVKTFKVFKNTKNILPFKNFLVDFNSFLFHEKSVFCLGLEKTPFFNYVTDLFFFNIKIIKKISVFNTGFGIRSMFVYNSISKPIIKDFFLDSCYTKSSSFLVQRSQEIRKKHHNFFIKNWGVFHLYC